MTLKELRDNVLRALWLEQQATVPSYIWEDVTTAINSALQLMFESPLDYFRKEQISVTFNTGEDAKNLSEVSGVTEVIGPVWIPAQGSRELHRITDQSEWNQLYQRFFGKTESEAIAAGLQTGSFYFIETRRSYSDGGGADASSVLINIKPAPTEQLKLALIVAKAAPSYSVATITGLSGSEVTPVPDAKMETILLPLARWYAMRSHFFFEKDKVEMFQNDAARAMKTIKVTDPEMGTASHMAEQIRKQSDKNTPSIS